MRLLAEMKPHHYFTRPSNMQYHNLCTTAEVPPGIASLLGMGLKFCIEAPRPNQKLDESIRRFRRTIRLHFHFRDEENKNNDIDSTNSDAEAMVSYIPSLYLPSTWSPPAKFENVEFALGKLDDKLNNFK
jgi:ribosomal protein S21